MEKTHISEIFNFEKKNPNSPPDKSQERISRLEIFLLPCSHLSPVKVQFFLFLDVKDRDEREIGRDKRGIETF